MGFVRTVADAETCFTNKEKLCINRDRETFVIDKTIMVGPHVEFCSKYYEDVRMGGFEGFSVDFISNYQESQVLELSMIYDHSKTLMSRERIQSAPNKPRYSSFECSVLCLRFPGNVSMLTH